jgi:aminopeptidase-like protein
VTTDAKGRIQTLLNHLDHEALGRDLHGWAQELYPLCRSITGQGLRATLSWIGKKLPLTCHEVPSGTPVLDWTVPREWNVQEAWIKDPSGRKVADFARLNLHLLGYRVPFQGRLPLEELEPHLYSLPDHPDWVPYRTSYYEEQWGFCLSHKKRQALPPGEYEVLIDSTLENGALSYGELVLPGEDSGEVLLSCHICHPSLANDNLSGLVLAVGLALSLSQVSRRYSYRFLFIPGTIGSITWLARNPDAADRIRHGFVLACLGDPGPFHYKRSRQGHAEVDRAVIRALETAGEPFKMRDFQPWGYDERQYSSPGFNLPVGSLSRTPHGQYPEYHTSADSLDLVRPQALGQSLQRYLEVLAILEGNHHYLNLCPKGEPQLGRRGLYRSLGGSDDGRERELALLWVLNLCDGRHDLLDISERSRLPFPLIRQAADLLLEADLLEEINSEFRVQNSELGSGP